jgi:hypothetical protein
MPVHTYSNWNARLSDMEEQVEPFRKYFFICEGANTETFYFKKLIDIRKELGIHPLIDIRLWEKTGDDRNLSFAKNLVEFAEKQKAVAENNFDPNRDKMIIVFDGDIFEEKVQGYEELVCSIEKNDIAAVSNPGFELFLLLHIDGSYKKYVKDCETEFLKPDEKGRYSHAYHVLLEATGINAKKNAAIGELAENVMTAIKQEQQINQDIHQIKGMVSSNVGLVIESIINEKPPLWRQIQRRK